MLWERTVMEWKTVTDDPNVSLHDHLITTIEANENIILHFQNGFDVTKCNPVNLTGRHMHTGKAAVILHNAVLLEGTKYLNDNSEKKLTVDDFSEVDFEVLSFSYEGETVELCGDAFDDSVFCKLLFKVSGVEFCWNEFIEEAWFQRDEN